MLAMRELGAIYDHGSGNCEFRVWAPMRESVDVKIIASVERIVPMDRDSKGYWQATVQDVGPGARYLFRLDNDRDRPDPASHYQPEGVHGPSQVVDHAVFPWSDGEWRGLPLESFIIYELHVATFTSQGTLEKIIPRLDALRDLGITAVELMPVSQFPGARNWGYDGVYPFAVQNSYGGPEGLKSLVDACHKRGMVVILDVVYNHLGPEGNYLGEFGPYFTEKYRTPWGQAINFDGPYSDDVRAYFIGNALSWTTNYHIDALRLDAIHGIFDFGAKHFLRELGEKVHRRAEELGRRIHVIPESDLNDARVIAPRELGGYGLDAQWNDDFHHCLRTLITGEKSGYYEDFGAVDQMQKAYSEGFVYSGQYSSFRKRRHGNSSKDRPVHQFVVFSQNHDQVGNRMMGDRLSTLVSFEALKLAAGSVLLSPYLPLLFMGEEYGETAPFLYFVSHSDPDLIEAVRKGRKEEFRHFGWKSEPPDPQDELTFLASELHWDARTKSSQGTLLLFYKRLIGLRTKTPALYELEREQTEVRDRPAEKVLSLLRWNGDGTSRVCLLLNFGVGEALFSVSIPDGQWEKVLDSSDGMWDGPGASLPVRTRNGDAVTMRGHCVAVYVAGREH
jgi:maltooligosyltrehalose trehalohydrolase